MQRELLELSKIVKKLFKSLIAIRINQKYNKYKRIKSVSNFKN